MGPLRSPRGKPRGRRRGRRGCRARRNGALGGGRVARQRVVITWGVHGGAMSYSQWSLG